ncbi:MAG: cysteine--tRNA ligase [Clostridiales bacterium]|nr:cysteine--tRNA ligase [Clostridiales bacterium]
MKLYNDLTLNKDEFIPIESGKVKMYSCGPTVYNYFHIGNARPFILFDALRKFLEFKGIQVDFVQNFTDVDDKMINKAAEMGISVKELGDMFIEEYKKDASALGISPPTYAPRATETIDEIIDMVKVLVDKGFAYEVDGDVYFSTKKFADYGALSHKNLDDLLEGARIAVGEKKQDNADFAVWKAQKTDDEIAWDSPWGKGRPGWHIECSCMAKKFLGDTIDIHTGGQDLIFPHHENEIAQSEASNGVKFSNFWIHNGYINIDNKKMSKSAGNFFTVREILKDFDGEIVRFFMLSSHYRSPINFSFELMNQAKSGLERIYTCLSNIDFELKNAAGIDKRNDVANFDEYSKQFSDDFVSALDDDFNTALAISSIFEFVRLVNSDIHELSKNQLNAAKALILKLGKVLSLFNKNVEQNESKVDDDVEKLIKEREDARKEKNFTRADEIREILKNKGIIIEDTPMGTKIV